MATIEILFELPSWIAKGLSDGTYELIGGVVRRVDGKKEIVAWLRSAVADLSRQVGPEPRNPLFDSLLAAMPGLQVTSLVMQVGSFVSLSRDLRQIRRMLEAQGPYLDRLLHTTKRIERNQIAKALADAEGAVQSARGSVSAQDLTALRLLRKDLISGASFLFSVAEEATTIVSDDEGARAIITLLEAALTCAHADVLVENILEGPKVAIAAQQATKERFEATCCRIIDRIVPANEIVRIDVVKNRESFKEFMRRLSKLRRALSAQTAVIEQHVHLFGDSEIVRLIDASEAPALIVVSPELFEQSRHPLKSERNPA